MSYVRAIEGDTNSQVLDPAFHRNVLQPPSQARELRTTGIPAPPVASINRPQMFSFPRPASPTATSDLRGQTFVRVGTTPAVRRQGNIIAAERSATIAQQRRDRQRAVQVLLQRRREGMGDLNDGPARRIVPGSITPANRGIGPAVQLLLAARPVKRRGMSGLGQITFPLPTSVPKVVLESQAAIIQAAIQSPASPEYSAQLAAELIKTGILKGTDAILFKNLTPAQQQQYIAAAKPAGSGIMDWFSGEAIAGIPNYALAASGGLLFILLAAKKKR